MKKYVARPVEIEAEQITLDNIDRLSSLCDGTVRPWGETKSLTVMTNHGPIVAQVGDWLIKGDDYYPCKDKVFRAKYEPAKPFVCKRDPDGVVRVSLDSDVQRAGGVE